MIETVSVGLSSLKAAFDLAKGLNALENATATNEVKLSLQSHILEAQQSLFSAQETQAASAKRIADLEAQIMRMKDWSSERERYELVNIDGNAGAAFAYMLRPGMRGSEPAHWLCANCFERGAKSILQKQPGKKDVADQAFHGCPTCKAVTTTHWRRSPSYKDEAA